MKMIKGIAWDHPRGYDSIVAASREFERTSNDCKVNWDKRSLTEFGDFPISRLVDNYDLLIVDHPFVGEAHAGKLLLPLDLMMSPEFLSNQSQCHIGPSYMSYSFAGHQYALPIDAAAQFCAFNADAIDKVDLPVNWDEFMELRSDVHFKNSMLWPLCPTDLWCSLLTLAAQLGIASNRNVFDEDGLNAELAVEALEKLKELTEYVSVECWGMNPIETLNALKQTGEYIFSPLLFGYSNYGRKGFGTVEFSNAIGVKDQKPISLLGGAGIAVSSNSLYKNEIKGYLNFIMRDEVFSGPYFEAGGQPSLKSSWNSKTLNASTLNFFRNTVDTMKNAFVRPTLPGFNSFQHKAAELVHRTLKRTSTSGIVIDVNALYHKYCMPE